MGGTANTSLGTDSYLAQIKTSGASAGLGIIRTADSVAPPFFSLAKSRNDGIVQDNDFLGKIQFIAHDGNDYNNVSALISAEVDGTPGSDDVPGRLTFHTTPDGASSPTEKVRIEAGGDVGIGTTNPSALVNIDIGGDQTWAQIDKSRAANEPMLQLIHSAGNRDAKIRFANADSSWSVGINGSEHLVFNSGETTTGGSGTERMKIHSNGDVSFEGASVTTATLNVTGIGLEPRTGSGFFSRNGNAALFVNRIAGDGVIVSIRESGTEEGTISVSGTTVSYNGGHLARWSQLAGGSERTEILRGSV